MPAVVVRRLARPINAPVETGNGAGRTRLDTRGIPVYLTDMLINQGVKDLDAVFQALGDATRRAILSRLARGEANVGELARPFAISLPAVSKHLKVLERAGLIERGREAQWRPCRLRAMPLQAAQRWLEQYRRFWEQSFDRLDAYLDETRTEENENERNP